MDEEKLREILEELEEKTKGMTDDEKETFYRLRLMDDLSTGYI